MHKDNIRKYSIEKLTKILNQKKKLESYIYNDFLYRIYELFLYYKEVEKVNFLLTFIKEEEKEEQNSKFNLLIRSKIRDQELIKQAYEQLDIDITWRNHSFIKSCWQRYDINQEALEFLLSFEESDPSVDNNSCIIKASYSDNYDILELLWKNDKIKSTLKNDDLLLFNELIKTDIQEKITNF